MCISKRPCTKSNTSTWRCVCLWRYSCTFAVRWKEQWASRSNWLTSE